MGFNYQLATLFGLGRLPGGGTWTSLVVLFSVQFLYTRIGSGVEFFPQVEPDLSKIVKDSSRTSLIKK